jgi:NAD(P)-dependent dehydrogenase (short-subunit alcohol dehydrogenase family)
MMPRWPAATAGNQQNPRSSIMSSQHVVIIGGSSGIGLATAKQLLQQDFTVTITGRDKDKLAAAAKSLNGDLRSLAFDAMNPAAIKDAVAEIGKFDHLVLAMGSGNGAGPFPALDMADLLTGFQTKLIPQAAVAQAALPFLPPTGSITFVSAISARGAMPGTAGLAAVNAGIEAMVPVLAIELQPLRVNAVSPGVVDTPWWNFMPSEQRAAAFQDFASRTPAGRIGKPEDIAQAIAFLIGNGFMSGHVIACDGGVHLGSWLVGVPQR